MFRPRWLHPCSLRIHSAYSDWLTAVWPGRQQTKQRLFSPGAYRRFGSAKKSGFKLTRHKIPAPSLYFLADLKTQHSISDKSAFLAFLPNNLLCSVLQLVSLVCWALGVHRTNARQEAKWGVARAGDGENPMYSHFSLIWKMPFWL